MGMRFLNNWGQGEPWRRLFRNVLILACSVLAVYGVARLSANSTGWLSRIPGENAVVYTTIVLIGTAVLVHVAVRTIPRFVRCNDLRDSWIDAAAAASLLTAISEFVASGPRLFVLYLALAGIVLPLFPWSDRFAGRGSTSRWWAFFALAAAVAMNFFVIAKGLGEMDRADRQLEQAQRTLRALEAQPIPERSPTAR
jgi:hypothetical protein